MARSLVALVLLTSLGCGDENKVVKLRLTGGAVLCKSDARVTALAAAIIDGAGVARDVDCVQPVGFDLWSREAVAGYYSGRGYVLRSITTTGTLLIGAYTAPCPASYSKLKFCLVGGPFPPSTDQLDMSMRCQASCPQVP